MGRKIGYVSGLILTILLLCACSGDTLADPGFPAEDGDAVTASKLPEEGSWISGRYLRAKQADLFISESGEPIDMCIQGEAVSCDSLESGDEIRVYMAGGIRETWPAQADVYAVEKTADGDMAEFSPELLEQLQEMGWLENTLDIPTE